MGLKEIFSSFKAATISKNPDKQKRLSMQPNEFKQTIMLAAEQSSHQKAKKNLKRKESTKSQTQEAANGLSTTPRTPKASQTMYLLQTHSKNIHKIIKENEMKTSPSFDTSTYMTGTTASGKRCKIRTNPWIRSPTFYSTVQFSNSFSNDLQLSQQQCQQSQQSHNTSTNSSSGISSISNGGLADGLDASLCVTTNTSSSISSTKPHKLVDDYSFKCEQTLELVELNSIFDNILLNNEEFKPATEVILSDYDVDRSGSSINASISDDNDLIEDEIELDKCVCELYKQIDMLKEQKKQLDEKVQISKKQIRI